MVSLEGLEAAEGFLSFSSQQRESLGVFLAGLDRLRVVKKVTLPAEEETPQVCVESGSLKDVGLKIHTEVDSCSSNPGCSRVRRPRLCLEHFSSG